MKRIRRTERLSYELDASLTPVLRVGLGETFVAETEDSASGCLRSSDHLPTPEYMPDLAASPPRVNPVVGPVFVEGVNPDDVMVVIIERIVPDAQGFTALIPGLAPTGPGPAWEELSQPQTQIIQHQVGPSGTYEDGMARVSDRLYWPLKPFIGTIAVAPEREVIDTGTAQGPWGGNLDVRDCCAGSRVYLNCYHEGGLLFLGDAHGIQGDMEFSGSADETRAEITLHCEVVRSLRIPAPRIETNDEIIALCSDRPLDLAVERASWFLMHWLVSDYGFSRREAYLQICLNPDFRMNVYQMVRGAGLGYTVGAALPKRYLGPR